MYRITLQDSDGRYETNERYEAPYRLKHLTSRSDYDPIVAIADSAVKVHFISISLPLTERFFRIIRVYKYGYLLTDNELWYFLNYKESSVFIPAGKQRCGCGGDGCPACKGRGVVNPDPTYPGDIVFKGE